MSVSCSKSARERAHRSIFSRLGSGSSGSNVGQAQRTAVLNSSSNVTPFNNASFTPRIAWWYLYFCANWRVCLAWGCTAWVNSFCSSSGQSLPASTAVTNRARSSILMVIVVIVFPDWSFVTGHLSFAREQ
ncbi:MAG: hypothetical protein HC804_06520 [Anaerolineae bacterium]|nr:hypothetical protein [Anaerolineae bacterium]